MNSEQSAIRQIRNVFIATVVIAGMYFASEFLQPVAMSVLLTFILLPLVRGLERFRLPRPIAIVFSLALVFMVIGGVGYVVGRQFLSLADHLPEYEQNIADRTTRFRLPSEGTSPITKAKTVIEDVQKKMGPAEEGKDDVVHVVQEQTAYERMEAILRPFHNVLGFVGIILILSFFMLLQHEELANRIVQLVGKRRISLTTRSMSQITQRLSRYLTTLAMFNTAVGTSVALGLWAIGLPYSVLWGTLMGLLRFVPYIGPVIGFSFPALFSLAYFADWWHPLLVVALFLVVEGIANALEPIIYGKSTGVSAVGLLIAAMFWTWLWGPLGLLLSTPITVCLLVVGKYIPGFEFIGILLGEESEFDDNLRLYQRLLRRDFDGAITFLDGLLESKPPEYVFDEVVIPALSRASQDRAQGILEEQDLNTTVGVLRQWLDELSLEGLPERPSEDAEEHRDQSGLPSGVTKSAEASPTERRKVVGVATGGAVDALVLRMLNLLLKSSGEQISIVEGEESPLQVAEQVAELEPDLVFLSYVPPVGMTHTRYLVKRLRAQLGEIPLLIGYWDLNAEPQSIEPMRKVGVYRVALNLPMARDQIIEPEGELSHVGATGDHQQVHAEAMATSA